MVASRGHWTRRAPWRTAVVAAIGVVLAVLGLAVGLALAAPDRALAPPPDDVPDATPTSLTFAETAQVSPSTTSALVPPCGQVPDLCVGAAKVAVTPAQAFVDGVSESRQGALTHKQRFNLGGYGINPAQGLPDPTGAISEALTVPAQARQFTGSHGPEDIWLRSLVVRQPGGTTVAFVTLDAIGAGNVIQRRLTQAVAAATGIPAEQVLFSQTHTHAGPDLQGLWGGVPEAWIAQQLLPAAVQATTEALRVAAPGELEVRSGPTDGFNRYRRPKRIDPDIGSDPVATLLRARRIGDGAVLGDLLQFSAHPTSVDEDPRVPHPDYVLGALDWLERDGGVALFVNGPIADASPAGTRFGCSPEPDGTYGEVRCRGEGIAAAVLALPARSLERPSLDVRHARAVLPVSNPLFLAGGSAGAFNGYYDFVPVPVADLPLVGPALANVRGQLPQLTPTAATQVSRITIGGPEHGLELVTIPGEATGTYGESIRALAAPGATVALLGLTHDSFGYIIPESEFSYVDASGEAGFVVPFTSYEEHVSLGPLTAPLLRVQAYGPLFGAAVDEALPPSVTTCTVDPGATGCILHALGRQGHYAERSLVELLRSIAVGS